jgi:hypothetical protein
MTPQEFWKWFTKNNTRFLNINGLDAPQRDALLDEILEKLHQYSKKLWVVIGGDAKDYKEFIITADGDTEHFDKVKTLVDHAPSVKNWKIIAFMPPIDFENITYEDVPINLATTGYSILINFDDVSAIAFTIHLQNYEQVKDSRWLEAAVGKMLDMLLGEQCFAEDVSSYRISGFDDDDEQRDYNILNLKNYIETKKMRITKLIKKSDIPGNFSKVISTTLA